MSLDKKVFKEEYKAKLISLYGKDAADCSAFEQYEALVKLIVDKSSSIKSQTKHRFKANDKKHVYYFSMEFLIGRLLENYVLNMGIGDAVRAGLKEMGIDFDELCECEKDPGLGNGGLGRLAACFLDSLAFLDINATGMGIRFQYGLFRQRITSGWQTEEPDAWLENGWPWQLRRPDEAVIVPYYGGSLKIKAVPYDVPVIGYGGETVNKLRLWNAQPHQESFDLEAFNRGDYAAASRTSSEAQAISNVLYPDDSTPVGRELRLKQEYFFVCAGLTSILRRYIKRYGQDRWKEFPDHVSIHINDTHPALCVPELMRLLLDEVHLEWDEAWDITTRAISYTNHTIMPEALEKWPVDVYCNLLPRIYSITEEIDRRYKDSFDRTRPNWFGELDATSIIKNGMIYMANLSVIGSHSVNGVAALHTDILKAETLKEFYALTPEKFNNKTNGVTHRRFLVQANPGLTKLINETIGDKWIREPERLEELIKFKNDKAFIDQLAKVKLLNKQRFAEYVERTNEIALDPNSVFDIQVKRIHAYKRQLLYTLKILNLYNTLKANPNLDIQPQTFILAGKAAASYHYAKETIKFYCSVADKINSDPDVADKIKVIFLENFNVSSAQLIYPAADISEQISTASKEASGTGNMKFMFNGAVTLGTLDGANVEIRELVGDDNIYIFGLKSEEVMNYYANGGYFPYGVVQEDERLLVMMDQLVNGFFSSSNYNFWGIHDELMKHGDTFFVLKDFAPYVAAWEKMIKAHEDKKKWYGMSTVNIAKAGYFSSDRTIREYAEDIWHA